MLSILVVILGFGLVIGLHELAHMLTAKAFGVKVLKFSFGFGPRLLGFLFKGTSYELRLLPLGGFVQFAEEDPSDNTKGGFFAVPWYKRALIALAGPVMNLLLGLAMIYALLLFNHWPVFAAVKRTGDISWFVIHETLKWFGGVFTAQSHMSDMAGPIMVTKLMVSSLKESVMQFFFLLSIVSLSLGLFNLLPIFGLDGGHVLLYIIEGIRGKKLPNRAYEIWNILGFVLLGLLMVFIIFGDITKLIKG
jgi:membrane-associated protease RseP (regulator of RpoE activity)